jgi:hypothetical protein
MFWEVRDEGEWQFAGEFVRGDEYDGVLVPQNAAPESWGKTNFSIYYAVSGERGFPDNLSATLRLFVDRFWRDANRPSWMTVEEMRAFYEKAGSEQYAHVDFESILQKQQQQPDDIRLVFWADQ